MRTSLLTASLIAVLLVGGCGGGSTTTVVQQQTLTVSPAAVNVTNFTTQQFSALLNSVGTTGVTWQVNGVTGGSQTSGFISSGGLYVAPSGVPTTTDKKGNSITTTVTVKAILQANTANTANAVVTIVPGNQNTQNGTAIELGTTGGNTNDSNTTGNTITCCGGTLGSLVTRGGVTYVLSNNHVLARSDSAKVGENIIQPGLIDTATCTAGTTTTIANLSEFFNLENSPTPNIDAAIAAVVAGKVDLSGNILYLGASVDGNGVPVAAPPQGGSGGVAALNMAVAKSGRSTGLTCSTVSATNLSTSVEYTSNCDGTGTKFTIDYLNQVDILGGQFSAEGDSGSLIVSQAQATPIALLYAGSDTDTVGNPVGDVLNFFKSGTNAMTFVGGAAHQVIACSLPNAPASASKTVAASLTTEVIQKAAAVRDAHATELMAHPEMQAVGVGASYDNPSEPAIILFVTQGQARTSLPTQVDGVRTRIVENDYFARRGTVSALETATLEQSVAPPQQVYSVSDVEVARAKVVHKAHVAEWMKKAGVQGVGIGSSVDSPGEAALMIFTIRGVEHEAIPAVIDGLRTRVRDSSRFKAGYMGNRPHGGCMVPPAKVAKTIEAAPESVEASTLSADTVKQ